MRVTVKLFALHRELVGAEALTADLADDATVQEAYRWLGERYPALRGHLDFAAPAINREFTDTARSLHDGDELAIIPPVSGGSAEPMGRVLLTREPLDPAALTADLATPEDGAVASFLGIVRDHAEGHAVKALEYHAYDAMAEEQLAAVGRDLTERFGVTHWLLAHRLGMLAIGDVSMVVAVASPHRQEAFEACRWAVDRIKSVVPIWKKEFFADSARWVGLEEAPPRLSE